MKCVVGNSEGGFSSFEVKHVRELEVPARTHTSVIIQGGARNVIPLIVHVTHFSYYKNI